MLLIIFYNILLGNQMTCWPKKPMVAASVIQFASFKGVLKPNVLLTTKILSVSLRFITVITIFSSFYGNRFKWDILYFTLFIVIFS